MEERKKIITPGTCDYFRKVLIPASLGDDTGEAAPKNGAYRNAIVAYAANGAVYIYSSDGIYTKIAGSVGPKGAKGDFEKLELTIDYNNGRLSTVKTVREVIDLFSQGKCLMSVAVFSDGPRDLTCLQIFYGMLIYEGGSGYLLTGFTHSPENVIRLEFSADNLDSIFTANLPS